jgi:hypothetical protein
MTFVPTRVDLGSFSGAAPTGFEGRCVGGPLNGQWLQGARPTMPATESGNKDGPGQAGFYTFSKLDGLWKWTA